MSQLGLPLAEAEVVVVSNQAACSQASCTPKEILTSWQAVGKAEAKQRTMQETVKEVRAQRQRHHAAVANLEALGAAHALDEGQLPFKTFL